MALFTLTINNFATALDKQHQEVQRIHSYLNLAAQDVRGRRQTHKREYFRPRWSDRCRQLDVHATGRKLKPWVMRSPPFPPIATLSPSSRTTVRAGKTVGDPRRPLHRRGYAGQP